ncbi:MAG TPA: hypothetical protein VFH94_21195, partial [Streptomyces sp.]|nr:hypothetical protein [Streptomyces sp.]
MDEGKPAGPKAKWWSRPARARDAGAEVSDARVEDTPAADASAVEDAPAQDASTAADASAVGDTVGRVA